MEEAFRIDMNQLVQMLENKAEELGSIYPQVSKLAMSVMNKETELRQMKNDVNHVMNLLERVKNEMSESLRAVEDELDRHGDNDGFFRQMLGPIMAIPDRILANAENMDEEEENNRASMTRRRRSSVTEMRYEIYNRMLKSLPDAHLVKEKMIADGFSETEIIDFFGIETAMTVAGGPSASGLRLVTGGGSGIGGGGGGGGGSLSGLDGEKYKKMLKLLPSSMVREKMLEVGFKDKEIDDTIGAYDPTGNDTPATVAPIAAKPIDPKYEKYFKMMKMLPEGAVRQKMSGDGLKESEIEEFFKQLVDVAVATASGVTIAPSPAADIDPKYEKFVKMMKMLPEGAVRQKMSTEGLSAADIDHFFNVVLPKANNPSAASASTDASSAGAVGADKYDKYTKMLKMLPEGAVRQKMAGDGVPESEINQFFGGSGSKAPAGGVATSIKKPVAPPVELPPPGMKPKNPVVPAKKMKGLFWTKIKNSDVPGTLWAEIEEFQFPKKSQEIIDTLFAAVTRAGSGGVESPDKGPDSNKRDKKSKAGVSLFDGKRVQGVLIFLGRVRKSPREIVSMILKLDPKVMTLGLTETILNICPTTEGMGRYPPLHIDSLYL
jgi:hypothetical protein